MTKPILGRSCILFRAIARNAGKLAQLDFCRAREESTGYSQASSAHLYPFLTRSSRITIAALT
jgi:hypothetical protein